MSDITKIADREILKAAVGSAIFCQVSGKGLDAKSAVLVEAVKGDRILTKLVVTAEVFDKTVKGNMATAKANAGAGTEINVYDGRVLFA